MFRRVLLIAVTATAGATMLSAPAGAASIVAYYHLNEGAGSDSARDSSTHNNDGDINGAHPGATGYRGTSYRFDVPSNVSVRSSSSLNPGSSPMTISLWLRSTGPVNGSPNVLQKGRSTVNGGNYKLEIEKRSGGGIARCHFRGSSGQGDVVGGPNVIDGRWHHIECIRQRDSVSLQVDDGHLFTDNGATGGISNSSPLTFGAKSGASAGDDQFVGWLDEIKITVG